MVKVAEPRQVPQGAGGVPEVRVEERDAELVDEIREVMASTFGMDESELSDDVSQETCDRWSSLYHITLIIALEERFNTTFSMDEMPEMTSLPKIRAILEAHGNVGAGR
jgi:acyl carrier protein